VTRERLDQLLARLERGELTRDAVLEELALLPYRDLPVARVDTHRALRQGMPEVIFGLGKSAEQIAAIAQVLAASGANALVTRVDPATAEQARALLPDLEWVPQARALMLRQVTVPVRGRGTILVVTAGTSDLPVAEEALLVAEFLGNKVERLVDVGVAGLHRLLAQLELLRSARVLIVVAGMEGALPSVVAGLVERPVIAVPTSIGYGASLGGVAALLGMLSSCAANVSVVNIDNGFGAAVVASLINRD
jgi:NCAIR mutase (PurE)-related protein